MLGGLAVAAALAAATPALTAPPDQGPIDGTATATQDPVGSCVGRPNKIPFDATVQVPGGNLTTTDPGGTTSGPVAADGTAKLTGATQSYELLSSTPTQLSLRELNGGCTFSTIIDLAGPLTLITATTP